MRMKTLHELYPDKYPDPNKPMVFTMLTEEERLKRRNPAYQYLIK